MIACIHQWHATLPDPSFVDSYIAVSFYSHREESKGAKNKSIPEDDMNL